MQYVVNAKRLTPSASVSVGQIITFGPFRDEDEAGLFFDRLVGHPDWMPDEIPVLNAPSTITTKEFRP